MRNRSRSNQKPRPRPHELEIQSEADGFSRNPRALRIRRPIYHNVHIQKATRGYFFRRQPTNRKEIQDKETQGYLRFASGAR